jgi:hypothetical protein
MDGTALLVKPAGEESYRVWNLSSHTLDDRFKHILQYREINGNYLVSKHATIVEAGRNHVVNVADGKRLASFPQLPFEATWGSGQFDRCVELGCFQDGTLRLVDGVNGQERGVLTLTDGEAPMPPGSISLSPDGRFACVATNRAVYLLGLSEMPAAKGSP